MAKSKLVKANEKIAENVVDGYKKIEEGVVGGFKKIEGGAVGGFNKMADKFADSFLTKEGETVEEARERLAAEQKAREEAGRAEREGQQGGQNPVVEESMQKAQEAAEAARRKAGLEK